MILLFAPTTEAAIQTFEGSGRYVMSDFENDDIAQQRAKQNAVRDACEKAAVYVKSFCQAKNIELNDDEIAALVNNIISADDVHIKKEYADINSERVTVWRATIKAKIDTEAINDFIRRKDK